MICWALHFLGLPDFDEHDSCDSQDFLNINSYSFPSVSADAIRDNLPVVSFGDILERFSKSMEDNETSRKRTKLENCGIVVIYFIGIVWINGLIIVR